jgi:large subunit ribosomal protein L17
MRHRKQRSKLSMKTSRRDAFVRAMVRSLVTHGRIKTSKARAKVVRRDAEHLITIAKNDTVFARQIAQAILGERDLVVKLFKEVIPLFKSRASGYTRIIPLGFRRGDGAELCFLELTERKIVEKLPKKKAAKAKASEEKAGASAARKDDAKEAETKEKKDEKHIKHVPKSKPTLEEEKRIEKAKSEDKKMTKKPGFMKNIRGLFRKRGDF